MRQEIHEDVSPTKQGLQSEAARRTCILVLGMHRSGTSALTRVLSLMGAALPKHVLSANHTNEAGHWEPHRLIELHDHMLAEAGSRWDDWRAFNPAVLDTERLAHYKNEISRLILEEYGDAPLFVLKDPRVCRFVPLYEDILAALGVDTRYVLATRNPLAVAASLGGRDGITEGFSNLLWLRHELDAELATRAKPRTFVSYEDMVADWRPSVERIVGSLGIAWPHMIENAAAGIESNFSAAHQHHVASAALLSQEQRTARWVKDTYSALIQLEVCAADTGANMTLDRVKAELDAVSPIVSDAVFHELGRRHLASAFERLRAENDQLVADKEHHAALASERKSIIARQHVLLQQLAGLPGDDLLPANIEANYPTDTKAIKSPLNDVEVPPVVGRNFLTKAIALYLPQFHPIPANDKAWGKGFTEWTNVTRGQPEFAEHFQPRIPKDFGFYDIRLPLVQRLQTNSARLAGISGFCYYHYWFDGEEPLILPINNHLNDPLITLPFCICFANENWTKKWDGLDQEVIYKQKYGNLFADRYWESIRKFLLSDKYLKDVDGLPILLVYRPSIIPRFDRVASRWRELAIASGLKGIHIIACMAFEDVNKLTKGPDDFYDFPPLNTFYHTKIHRCGPKSLVSDVHGVTSTQVHDYRQHVMAERVSSHQPMEHYPGVMPSWDNTARRPRNGAVFSDSTPELFEEWVTFASRRAQQKANPFLFINAWNEWAEGAYLEPDRKYGWRYLNALSRGLGAADQPSPKQINKPICIFVHVHYLDIWNEIQAMIAERVDVPFYLVVTTSDKHISVSPPNNNSLVGFKRINIRNKGRDIFPFLSAFQGCDFDYDIGIKIHTKKSPHRADGHIWRQALLNDMLPRGKFKYFSKFFEGDPNLGFLAPSGHFVRVSEYIGSNKSKMELLADKLNTELTATDLSARRFIAGSMFWFRKHALVDWQEPSVLQVFEPESGLLDATMAHASERLFAIMGERRAYFTVPVNEIDACEALLDRKTYPLAHRLTLFSDQRQEIAVSSIPLSRVDFAKQGLRSSIVTYGLKTPVLASSFRRLPTPIQRFARRLMGMTI